ANDLANRRKSETGAGLPCRKERFKQPARHRFLDAAAGIAHGDTHVTTGCDDAMALREKVQRLFGLRRDADGAGTSDCLRRIGTQIEDDLLDLRRLSP